MVFFGGSVHVATSFCVEVRLPAIIYLRPRSLRKNPLNTQSINA